jgi:hypothetical protein
MIYHSKIIFDIRARSIYTVISTKTKKKKLFLLCQNRLLVEIVWVGVGFGFENPHQAELGFSDLGGFDVGFTVGF